MIRKDCPVHGHFEDVYWSDYEMFKRFEKYGRIGVGLRNPRAKTEKECPYDCGICPNHKSHTVLAIIDVTNACNLRCSICFAYAGATGYLYKPDLGVIEEMMDDLRSNLPVPPPALQLSGGEPTVRSDLLEIIKMAKRKGFRHVELNTNGVRIGDEKNGVEYIKELREAGVDTFYLSFDGVTPEAYIGRAPSYLDTQEKIKYAKWLYETKLRAIRNCREAGHKSVVLVPVIVKGMNGHQLGNIIRYAVQNIDVVRCVNFQPVSFAGRTEEWEVKKGRITIPEVIQKIEEQTRGVIKSRDFYPIPCTFPISDFLNAYKSKPHVEFTCHPHCGASTYLYVENGGVVPITKLGDVDKFFTDLSLAAEDLRRGQALKAKLRVGLSVLSNVKPKILMDVLPAILTGSYESLKPFHYKTLMIGLMHFMDAYNFDLERVQRCTIHYGFPGGKTVPFCTMNTIHRQKLEKMYATPLLKKTYK
ncbi:MAG: tetraether lipid synthase Tes, partial [Candidatus Bathyarchaeia archaeon]